MHIKAYVCMKKICKDKNFKLCKSSCSSYFKLCYFKLLLFFTSPYHTRNTHARSKVCMRCRFSNPSRSLCKFVSRKTHTNTCMLFLHPTSVLRYWYRSVIGSVLAKQICSIQQFHLINWSSKICHLILKFPLGSACSTQKIQPVSVLGQHVRPLQ